MIPFMPTIIEHAAALIGQTPSAAARDTSLLAMAHIKAYNLYRPDTVTVGMDIYNIEAEALGCHIRFYDDTSIPGIITHPFKLDSQPSLIRFSTGLGRIQMLLDAASTVKNTIGDMVRVNVGICGPFSVLIELLGYDMAIHAFIAEDERIPPLLAALTNFQKHYCDAISEHGLGVTIFESWASPPLISPGIYKKYALPYEQALLAHLKTHKHTVTPLIIGGDTYSILENILNSGTTLLVSDYNTPLDLYIQKAQEKDLWVRANIDPKLVRQGRMTEIEARIKEIYEKRDTYPKIIIGTGVVPYDTPPENLLNVRRLAHELSQ